MPTKLAKLEVDKPSSNGVKIEKIVFPGLELKKIIFRIVGTAPLISHKWSDKAKEMIRRKQQKEASRGKPVRDPHQEFLDSLYVIDPEAPTYGFPIIAFKAAAVNAALQVDVKKTHMRAAFRVENGISTPHGELVKLEYSKLVMREDMVRIGMGVADLRYRGEFQDWRCDLNIEYNARMISLEQLAALFNAAGFGVGLGEHRPEKDGMNGTFEVGEIFDGNHE